MREIKFKYWDGEYKKMCFVRSIVWHGSMIANIEVNDSKQIMRQVNEFYPHALLQYTGLRDRNNKEIYEGDIVSHCYIEKGKWKTGFTTKVKWSAEGLYWNVWVQHEPNKKNWVVIGNVYENPELMEDK